MSHWLIYTCGTIENILTRDRTHHNPQLAQWLVQIAAEIEQQGDHNETNSGFLLLKEEPEDGNLRAVVLPDSIDLLIHDSLKTLPALVRMQFADPAAYTARRRFVEGTIRNAMRATLHMELNALAENLP